MGSASAASAAYSSARAVSRTAIPSGPDAREGPGSAAGGRPIQAPASADLSGVEDFAHLLARAVRQCRTYPAANPLCAEAIAACHKALAARVSRDRIVFRVRPRELVVEETPFGAGTIVEQELARRLHRSQAASLRIETAASRRDLARFCAELGAPADRQRSRLTLAELLVERGVDRVAVVMALRPEVLDVGAPDADRRTLVLRERERRAALPAPATVAHLYPPDRGWIRLDPAVPFSTVSLTDLALLVDDPADLAAMLLRLTDGGSEAAATPQEALQITFSDVAMVCSSLDPRVARLMLARLARAVLALDAPRRTDLLQRTILPGLLDGRADGAVLRDFPDVDLAESLCLLLDLETAAPEVVATALDRLDLPPERREAVVPLLDERLRRRATAALGDRAAAAADQADRYARTLMHVDGGRAASFADFAAFDLSIDEDATRAIAAVRDRIGATDVAAARLQCLSSLIHLEPNPELVQTFLSRAQPLLADLDRAARWADLARWLARFREIAGEVRESRPDVAETIAAAFDGFFTHDRLATLCELYERDDESRAAAGAIVRAAGPGIGGTFVSLIESAASPAAVRAITQVLCDHAPLVAPAIADRLADCEAVAARAIVRALGHAGARYEAAIAGQLGHRDEQTAREALRALARIGSPRAASLVAEQIAGGPVQVRAAAEEALWHFPPHLGAAQVRQLLGHRAFVRGNPQAAARLLERAVRTHAEGLDPVIAALAPLRFHLWSPALARVGRKARSLVAS